MTKYIETCDNCEHLLTQERKDMYLPEPAYEYYCDHYDHYALDSNEQGPFIGFLPIIPDWCPLKQIKQWDDYYDKISKGPENMHYMIIKWTDNIETGEREFKVVECTEKFEEYEELIKKYPESNGYYHMIDTRWLVGHDVQVKLKAMKERIRNETSISNTSDKV